MRKYRSLFDLKKAYHIHAFAMADQLAPQLRIKTMLSAPQDKLGEPEEVLAWNVGILDTCAKPDQAGFTIATAACRAVCYGIRSDERGSAAAARAKTNFTIANRSDFADIMIGAIYESGVVALRIHSIGDIFSEAYFRAWTTIVSTCRDVRFWCYSRAWRKPAFVPLLAKLASCNTKNLLLWLSVDQCAFAPPKVLTDMPNTRVCGLLLHDEDHPQTPCSLLFRASRDRVRVPLMALDGMNICPHENGIPTTPKNDRCIRCRICLPRSDP